MTGVAEEVQQRFDHASKDYVLQQTRTLLATRAKELRQEAQVCALLALLVQKYLLYLLYKEQTRTLLATRAKELRQEVQVLVLHALLEQRYLLF